ncbi:MAG TPA: MerR family transcriptional regulator [Gemmatimonadales bacterium]|nr:MerR family transcriptional regulator [Gemmatimonadales bacterium]
MAPKPVARSDRTYEIHEVAELTGLAPSRLRAWERRYEVVRPRRMPNGYRLYTGDQVTLLRAYARLIEAGERIGDLAARPCEQVLARAAETRSLDGSPHAALMEAIRALDRERLEGLVAQQLALRGLRAFAGDVVLPLARSVGDLWADGGLPIASEHLASEVILHALKGGLRMSRDGGARVVSGCLPGERHEWGLLATLAMLQEDGWRIHYLGPDLPVPELARAAWKLSARAVALSGSDPEVVREALPSLAALPGKLPPGSIAVIGGTGVERHAGVLRGYGFRLGAAGLSGVARGDQ